jgi:uncharacterized protein YdhG (YjbR/CyaY superfamily)
MANIIDKYIKSFTKEEKKALEELRQVINSVSNEESKFEECLYYEMPAFRYKGKVVACFCMYKNHIGYYPCSGSILKNFSTELKLYKTSIGAVQFPKDKKLPNVLIRKIVKMRMKEIDSKLKK